MFWTDRLKHADAEADGSWVLSYGDLVSLLLVIFVMIAAMGDLRSGDRFGQMSEGVRQAFGFSVAASAGSDGVAESHRSQTLLERLEEAGFRRESSVQLIGPDDERLAHCDVLVGQREITIRIAGHASFAEHSAAIESTGEKALCRIGEYLTGGVCRVEVRGHAEAGPLPLNVPFRDGMDLSYARARAVTDVLEQNGVSRGRMFVTAWADHDPLSAVPGSEGLGAVGAALEASVVAGAGRTQVDASAALPESAMPEGAERRIEIVVHGGI